MLHRDRCDPENFSIPGSVVLPSTCMSSDRRFMDWLRFSKLLTRWRDIHIKLMYRNLMKNPIVGTSGSSVGELDGMMVEDVFTCVNGAFC